MRWTRIDWRLRPLNVVSLFLVKAAHQTSLVGTEKNLDKEHEQFPWPDLVLPCLSTFIVLRPSASKLPSDQLPDCVAETCA